MWVERNAQHEGRKAENARFKAASEVDVEIKSPERKLKPPFPPPTAGGWFPN